MKSFHFFNAISLLIFINHFEYFRMRKSTIKNFMRTSYYVYHIEADLFQSDNIIYTDLHSLKTTDFKTSLIIAGSTSEKGYIEGRGTKARFAYVEGFIQITETRLVVADRHNNCLRHIDRVTGQSSQFSGQCQSEGFSDGRLGQFDCPSAVIRDKRDKRQLLVADQNNQAVRTIDAESGTVSTFIQSDSLYRINYVLQDLSGNMYVTANHAIYLITYRDKTVKIITGSPGINYISRDDTLRNALFFYPREFLFIGPDTLLVAEYGGNDGNKTRLVDMSSDRVTTLRLCSGCLDRPHSLLAANNSLFVGQFKGIHQFECKYTTFL